MTQELEGGFRVVDRRHTASAGQSGLQRDIPAGYRPHSVLLGYLSDDDARAFLRDKGAHPDAVDALLQERMQAQARIRTLPAFAPAAAALPVQDGQAVAEIRHIMSRPECKAAFPDGTWTAELVEIAKLISVQPSLDVRYAESFGARGIDPSNPISAVRLCFAAQHSSPFHVSLDQPQKSVSITGIHPDLEVVSLRCSQQGDVGPLIVSFMVAAPPNLVVVLRYSGRLLLCGGYHRVYRLMQAGFSHVPCIVQEVPGLAHIVRSGPFFFPEPVLLASRPPLFTDFADPGLGIVAPLRAVRKVVRLRPDEYPVAS